MYMRYQELGSLARQEPIYPKQRYILLLAHSLQYSQHNTQHKTSLESQEHKTEASTLPGKALTLAATVQTMLGFA